MANSSTMNALERGKALRDGAPSIRRPTIAERVAAGEDARRMYPNVATPRLVKGPFARVPRRQPDEVLVYRDGSALAMHYGESGDEDGSEEKRGYPTVDALEDDYQIAVCWPADVSADRRVVVDDEGAIGVRS